MFNEYTYILRTQFNVRWMHRLNTKNCYMLSIVTDPQISYKTVDCCFQFLDLSLLLYDYLPQRFYSAPLNVDGEK
jgi:hypothetical protein